MKGFFSFVRPKQRRFAMQFGYEARPSFWQNVRSNSHLVIAATGTMALLGVAGMALWLAMPTGERQAFANASETAETRTVESAAADGVVAMAPQAVPEANDVTSAKQAAEADIPALPANDPRWTDPNAPRRPSVKSEASAASAVQAQATATAERPAVDPASNPQLAAFVAENAAAVREGVPPDSSATAAISAVKPERQAAKTAPAESAADPETAAATTAGHIARAVTMRAGPKKGAAAIATVPARTAVQVVSCEKWCQIVYNGKRGWIYKSFLNSGH